ncbi:prolyl oligopeptidase family serine peptidase [Ammoniphilus sp. YIM 78166]|uniref:prolyl oligopeptidase family serine peptidase n=1 Tax=Ammoniphilus sp. YIM 78166 TaxID=1644106 RepID=UPI00106FCD76|nr:prolyl oligopeptidase family serine peptidase [Ammoniphilus sp. YIM 78166]
MNYKKVDHIPVIWREPKQDIQGVVIWLTGFSGNKEKMIPYLETMADNGLLAFSFDPHEHGERLLMDHDELRGRIKGNLRRYFWPILAITSEEMSRIIDWISETFPSKAPIMVGGISMGGDISVVSAGLDKRISKVAASIATPDWLRPGSWEPQGEADTYAWHCYHRCNPLSNLHRYQHLPSIRFFCGAEDGQVPPDGAERFVDVLRQGSYKHTPERLDVVKLNGVSHEFVPRMLEASIQFFLEQE